MIFYVEVLLFDHVRHLSLMQTHSMQLNPAAQKLITTKVHPLRKHMWQAMTVEGLA